MSVLPPDAATTRYARYCAPKAAPLGDPGFAQPQAPCPLCKSIAAKAAPAEKQA
jgi:hypothetical protein